MNISLTPSTAPSAKLLEEHEQLYVERHPKGHRGNRRALVKMVKESLQTREDVGTIQKILHHQKPSNRHLGISLGHGIYLTDAGFSVIHDYRWPRKPTTYSLRSGCLSNVQSPAEAFADIEAALAKVAAEGVQNSASLMPHGPAARLAEGCTRAALIGLTAPI